MHAAEGPQRVDRAVSSPLSIISLGDVGGDGGVTDRATRGACAAVAFVLRCFLARECCTCPSANLATTGRVALSYLIRPSWTCVGACISLPWCLRDASRLPRSGILACPCSTVRSRAMRNRPHPSATAQQLSWSCAWSC